jgi:flagellar biosynthesis protein FlhB
MAAGAVALAVARELLWVAGLVGIGLALLDLVATRHSWFKRLRMTKDEVKREHREAEGDPQAKAERARAHREVLAGSAVLAVRDATVVVVNPTHLATALRYEEDADAAPRVISQGAGDLARRIIEAAHHYNVPVVRDVPVAHALRELEVGDEIPEALYEAVAEVLREVWGDDPGNAD